MITGEHYFKHHALLQSFRFIHSTEYKIHVDNDQNIKHLTMHIKKT